MIGYFTPGRSKSALEDPQKQIALLIKGKFSEDPSVFSWQPQAERNPPLWLTQRGQLQQEQKVSEEGTWQEHSKFVLVKTKSIFITKSASKTAENLLFILNNHIKTGKSCQYVDRVSDRKQSFRFDLLKSTISSSQYRFGLEFLGLSGLFQ
jgi:hypothetical protein